MKPVCICYILLLTSIACSTDIELTKSTFIPDKDIPELPAYSEWGYNTFGAYYERQFFTSNNQDVPLKIVSTDSVTTITFNGQLGAYSGNKMSLVISLSDSGIRSLDDLISLNATTINLASPDCKVSMLNNNVPVSAQILNGVIEFKRLQNLLVDKKQTEVIVSGTFEFQAIINGEPVSMIEGRFDMGVSKVNFFAI
jgi:hypothetical protein